MKLKYPIRIIFSGTQNVLPMRKPRYEGGDRRRVRTEYGLQVTPNILKYYLIKVINYSIYKTEYPKSINI